MKKIAVAVASALTVVGLSLSGAGIASADESDYINDLQQSGYGFTGPIDTWITAGYAVCYAQGQGESNGNIAAELVANTGAGIYTEQANFIVESAEMFLC